VKDRRPGESLWLEWDDEDQLVYYTLGHVSLQEDVIRRALASVLQRDGIVDSLGEGFRAVEGARVEKGYFGPLPDDEFYLRCDADGETYQDGMVEEVFPATFVSF
jgi:hypothetical protein